MLGKKMGGQHMWSLDYTNTYHVHCHRLKTGPEGLWEPVVVKKHQELQLRQQTLNMLRVWRHEWKQAQKDKKVKEMVKKSESKRSIKSHITENRNVMHK